MSVGDFEGMDCDDFEALCAVRAERDDMQRRESWERARTLGVLSVSPWSKRGLRPEKVWPLPWDKPRRAPERTAEDNRRNIELLARLVGK